MIAVKAGSTRTKWFRRIPVPIASKLTECLIYNVVFSRPKPQTISFPVIIPK
ncbi:hypothetical protein AZA_40491 [Nitrospirillum viridazoti Y2]|nr:hypothetical protein AZA_40491 [Nitrospirillum amazonense Y2]